MDKNILDASGLGKNLIRAINQDDSSAALDILHRVSFPKGSYYLTLAMTRATVKGNYAVSVALTNAGSDINGVNDSIPLINAVLSRQYDLVRYLLESGADTERQDENSHTALMHAVFNQDIEAIMLLIEAGASCQTETYDGVTDQDIAERQNEPSIWEYLRHHQIHDQ
ncbi:ankyrin repeat domain-containing protein [Nostoc sp. FACHB-280]|nr:ankyrin repeat domain-containing protein [Nostoc sp. FACHB-280]